jgi:hypothetical protein
MSYALFRHVLPIALLATAFFQPAVARGASFSQATGAQPGDAVTYHYDNQRTGWNQSETALTAASVGGGQFGLLEQVALDEQVDAQPLFLGGETIAGQGTFDVVYVATENNTVYAIDANSGNVLTSNNLGQAVPISALPGYCNNNSNNMGINSTPVIDRNAGLLYVIANTFVNNTPVFYLHALSLTTLQDAMTPVAVYGQSTFKNGKAIYFVSANNRQRAGLVETGGNIYAGFASWCDINSNVSRGWVLGWNASTLAPLPVSVLNNRKPKSPDDFFLTSVWMSGYGIASDDNGSLFLVTGNSDYSGTTWNKTYNLAESVVKLSTDLTTVESFYTPNNPSYGWKPLDRDDGDFGSAGVLLLPAQPGKYPNMAVAAGKQGPTYLLNQDNLGGLGEPSKTLGTVENDGCWCGQSYFVGADGNARVVTSTGNTLRSYKVETSVSPRLALETSWYGVDGAQDPGFFTTISSNGTQAGSAVVWAMARPTDTDPADVTLYAFDPTNASGPIWSGVAGTWPFAGSANANLVPVVANGHVFVASYGNLSIFGVSDAARHKAFRAPPRPQMVIFPGAPHELRGMVMARDTGAVTLRLRNGAMVKVDIAAAQKASHVAPPSVGHAALARGAYGKDGVFEAVYLLHQKDSEKLWPADR